MSNQIPLANHQSPIGLIKIKKCLHVNQAPVYIAGVHEQQPISGRALGRNRSRSFSSPIWQTESQKWAAHSSLSSLPQSSEHIKTRIVLYMYGPRM